jgi:hypothetical protein
MSAADSDSDDGEDLSDDEDTGAGGGVARVQGHRSARRAERKLHNETVVKSALRQYIVGDGETKDRVIDAIQARVDSYSIRVASASRAFCGLLKELFNGRDVTDVALPDICDVTIFRQLMLGADDAVQPNVDIFQYYEWYPRRFKDPPRHLGDRNIYSSGAATYVTNLKVSLWQNFEPRLETYLHRRLQDVHPDAHKASYALYKETLHNVMGWDFRIDDIRAAAANSNDTQARREDARATVQEIRHILGLPMASSVSDFWLKSEAAAPSILRLYVHFNRFYKRNELPMFDIVPICRVKSHFITIDWSVLYGILQELGMVDCYTSEAILKELKEEIWESVFDIQPLRKGGAVEGEEPPVRARKFFSETLQTDGTSLCTHFWRRKQPVVRCTSAAFSRVHLVR